MAIDTRQRAKEYLLANPTATNKDAAASVGVSLRTIGYARAELVNAGLIPPAWGDHKSKVTKGKSARVKASVLTRTASAAEGTPFDTDTTSDLNARVAEQSLSDDIDDEEIEISKLKRILWRIARTDSDNRIRTSAIWTLTRIQQDMDERPLGPGVPRNKADSIARLLDIFDGCGAAIVIEAMQAFLDRRKGNDSARKLSPDTGATALSSAGVAESPGSIPVVRPDDGPAGPVQLALHFTSDEHSDQG